ncbi:MAG: type IV pilus secretin PilQ [Candidatus Competibacteraceae bacterium]
MASRFVGNSQRGRRPGGMGILFWLAVIGLSWGVTLAGSWSGAVAQDAGQQPVLQAVDVNPLPGNRLQIRFRLSAMPKAPPSSFTINDPARIVLDFLGTTNGLKERQQTLNIGVADKLSVLEGADRTRASLNLARVVPYNVQVQGNVVVLTLENAGVASAKTPAVSATSSVVAAGAKRSEAPPPAGGPRNVKDISFKRGPAGQGIITLKLSNPGIAVDVRQEGNQIVADFQGAPLSRGQERRLDVGDFATPVTMIEALNRDGSARLVIKPNPPFEFLAYQANDLYVVEVKPPTPKTTAEEEKEAEFDPSKKKYKGDLLSLNFQDIEVRAILQILADFTGLNLVVSDSVKGNLTLRLQNVPWDQALDIILRTKGLAMRQNGNVIFIAPTEEVAAREKLDLESRKVVQELVPLRSEIIQVNYAKAQGLADLLKKAGEKGQSMLSPRGDVVADERTNSLIVKDVPDKLAEVRNLVTKLDKPTRQVMIDSRVVIATDDFAREIGVRFGVTGVGVNDSNVAGISGSLGGTNTIIGSAANNLITTGQPYPVAIPPLAQRLGVDLAAAGAPAVALSILGADYLVDLELSALQTEGNGEVLSNPRVVTADNQEATIKQGREIPYTVPSSGTGPATTAFKEAVLELKVTPKITPDDRIGMKLVIKKDDVGEVVPQAGGGFVPSIDKREVTTNVLVNNGETVVLGGVFEQTKLKSKSAVPLLGDIPLLGYLFQNNSTGTAKRELLIFVTPQILKEGAAAER